jgi:hypothetical protein
MRSVAHEVSLAEAGFQSGQFMKKLIFALLTTAFFFASCSEKNDKINEKSAEKNSVNENKEIVESYRKIISKYSKNNEYFIYTISPNLIMTGRSEIGPNYNGCSLVTELIRLSDSKKLVYSDIFTAEPNKIAEVFEKEEEKENKFNKQEFVSSLQDLQFKTISKDGFLYYFNIISNEDNNGSLNYSCWTEVFEEKQSFDELKPFLKDWIRKELEWDQHLADPNSKR